MKRNQSRLLSVSIALLLGLMLAVPGTGSAAPTTELSPATVPIPDPRDAVLTGVPLPNAAGATPQLLAAELSVTSLTEDCGSVDNDGIAYVDESCTVTVEVTDSVSGATVSGATVTIAQTTATTNSQGVASLQITSLNTGYNPIIAASGAKQSDAVWFWALERGTGLFLPSLSDKDGNNLGAYQLILLQESANSTSTFMYDIPDGYFPGAVKAGQHRASFAAEVVRGEGYLMDLEAVTIADGAMTEQTVDGSLAQPVTVAASLNGTPVDGAAVWFTSTYTNASAHRRGVTSTDANGEAVVYAFQGSYEAVVMGGSPAVFGRRLAEVAAETMGVPIDLTETATLNWAPQSTGTVTEDSYIHIMTDFRRGYSVNAASATVQVEPGDYMLRARATVTDSLDEWDYYFFGLPGPDATPWEPYPFQAGQTYSLTGAGPWSMNLQTPEHLSIGEEGGFSFSLIGSDSELYAIRRYPLGQPPSTSGMTTAIKNPAGATVASEDYASLFWTATAPDGRYTFTADVAPGPFFPEGTDFTASTDFLVGTALDLHFAPHWVAGTKVLPGGRLGLSPEILDQPAGVESLTLEILYDPSQVTFIPEESLTGNGSILEGNGSLRWTWTKGTVELKLPTLVFEAVSGFFGEAKFAAGPGSTIKAAGVTKPLAGLDLAVPVAKTAVLILVPGNTYPTAAIATDGVTSQWALRYTDPDQSPETAYANLALLDLPPELTTAVVMAPFHITQEVAIQVPDTGVTMVEVPLRYGDVDSNGMVDADDLMQIGQTITPPVQRTGRFESLFDVNLDEQVDIVDVVQATRNFGAVQSNSTPGGAIVVEVVTTGLTVTQPAQLTLRHGYGAEYMTPAIAYLTLTPGQSTFAGFEWLPPGVYWIGITWENGSTSTSEFVVEDGMITEIQLNL